MLYESVETTQTNRTIVTMSGAGNLFSVMDNRYIHSAPEDEVTMARAMCAEDGTDGFIILDHATLDGHDFAMRYYNNDGSSGAMCGNGARCIVEFSADCGAIRQDQHYVRFHCVGESFQAERLRPEYIRVLFPSARQVVYPFHIAIQSACHHDPIALTVSYVDVAVDHCVVYYPELGKSIRQPFDVFDIDHYGSLLRHHPAFERGANVNFYTIVGENTIKLRTYERGVERETGACGSGALATALTAVLRNELSLPLQVIPTRGEILTIDAYPDIDAVELLVLEGPAKIIARRTIVKQGQKSN